MVFLLTLFVCFSGGEARPTVDAYVQATPIKLTFAEAVAQARAHNTSAEVARQEIGRAMGLLEQVRAASLPVLSGQAGLARLNAPRQLGANLLAGQSQRSAALNLTVPLVAPRAWADWAEARTAEGVAWASDANVHRQVAMSVAQAYLAIMTQTNIVAVNESAVQTDRAHYEFAEARFRGGVGTRLDQLRADQELGNSEVQLQNALSALDQAREALGILTGRAGPVDVADDMPMEAADDEKQATCTAESLRADVRLAQELMAQADQVRQHTWLDFAPSLFGTGQLSYSYPGTASLPERSWELQLILQVPLFDGGTRFGAVTVRDALQRQAHLRLQDALRQAHSEVRLAYATVTHAEIALEAAERAAARAQEALTLANAAYHAGTTGNLEVIDAERVNRDAHTAAIVAQDNLRRVRLDVVTAAGKFP